MQLASHRYGKQQVRVLRLSRDGDRRDVVEITVDVLLEGVFERSYLSDDNSQIVPTDTVKNTIQALAQDLLRDSIEEFAIGLGRHFLNKYNHITGVQCDIEERIWQRLSVGGEPHSHTFQGRGPERPFTRIRATPEGVSIESGIRDLLLMKATDSAFVGYPKCDFTTLPETTDRILATSIEATWTYSRQPASFRDSNAQALETMIAAFATQFSPSAQRSLYRMADAALRAVPEIKQIALKLPNKHYLLVSLEPFGRENANEIFLPTDEPYGEIEAVVRRD